MEIQWVFDLLWNQLERLSGWKPNPDTRDRLQFVAALVGIGAALYGIRSHIRNRQEQAAWREEQKKEHHLTRTQLQEMMRKQDEMVRKDQLKDQINKELAVRIAQVPEQIERTQDEVPIRKAESREAGSPSPPALPLQSALTLRAAMRYLPTLIQQNDAAQAASSFAGKLRDTNHSIEDGNSRRLNEAANILRAFRACQTSFYVNQFCATAGAEAIIASAPGIAAEATHAAVLLAALWSDGLPRAVEAMAKATGSASGGATVAALSRVGAPTPRPPAEATEIARATAADVAEQGIFAAELEADGTSLHWAGPTPSPLQGDAKEQTIRLLSMPLWSKGMPAEAQTAWRRLRERTLALESGLKNWVEWYEQRLWGGPANLAFERELAGERQREQHQA